MRKKCAPAPKEESELVINIIMPIKKGGNRAPSKRKKKNASTPQPPPPQAAPTKLKNDIVINPAGSLNALAASGLLIHRPVEVDTKEYVNNRTSVGILETRRGSAVVVEDPDTVVISRVEAGSISNLSWAQSLLQSPGSDVNARLPPDGLTPLMVAARNGDTHLVRALLSRGANLNLICTKRAGTALVHAVVTNHIEVVKELVAAGATVEIRTLEGHTALMYAVHFVQLDTVSFLVNEGGARADATNFKNGASPSSLLWDLVYTNLIDDEELKNEFRKIGHVLRHALRRLGVVVPRTLAQIDSPR